jgi:hypothetical protein
MSDPSYRDFALVIVVAVFGTGALVAGGRGVGAGFGTDGRGAGAGADAGAAGRGGFWARAAAGVNDRALCTPAACFN